ncbi:hypothetical protein [Streptomyces sp. NPDC127033]|uniref:hypothetical protein n=1 Tax=Streptomyces sp. NPDC127033 TaxID=3347110 RepID=UPI00365A89EC
MTVTSTSSMFAAVARHFENPRTAETVQLTAVADNMTPVRLTPAQARGALYAPGHDPALVAPIWDQVVRAAAAEHGPSDPWRLLLIWLALPRLTGTAFRVCRRLRADRADVEAEMVLALLEGLRSEEQPSAASVDALLKTARSRAWRLARAGAREFADDTLERLSDGRTLPYHEPQNTEQVRPLQVEVTRHEGTDGLGAQLRFTVSPESVGRQVLTALAETAERKGAVCRTREMGHGRRVTADSRRRGRGRR